MIKDISIDAEQKAYLESMLEFYLQENDIEPTGLEVTHLQDEGDCFKVFYNYEKVYKKGKSHFMNTSDYLTRKFDAFKTFKD